MDRLVLDLVHGITSPDAAKRDRSADEVTDVHRGLSDEDVALLAHTLVGARLVEHDTCCQEAQLHALAELAEWHSLPTEAVGRLRSLSSIHDPSQAELLRDLLDDPK